MQSEPLSHWQRTVPAFPLATDLPPTADIVVVGGGLLGTATCYWLARTGAEVVLLEKTALAWGATGRNGGFVRAGPAGSYLEVITRLGRDVARATMDVTLENQTLLRQVIQEEAIACEYREPGTLQLAMTEVQAEHSQQEIDQLRADGYTAEWLTRTQVQELIQAPLGPEMSGARFYPQQGLVHSARLVHGLMQAAQRSGARAYQAEVSSIERTGSAIRVQTSRGMLVANTAVVAANAWTSTVLPEVSHIIMPVLEQMLAYAPIAPIFDTGISVDIVDGEYLHQTPSGSILVGGCGILASNAGVGIWESVPLPPVQEALERIVPRIFPALTPQLHVTQRWAGLMGCTTDLHPIVDYAPSHPGVLFVGGFSGHGMPFGLRFGQLLSEAALSGELPAALWPFRLDRPSLGRWDHPWERPF
jgi:glycine/D-amino acid oxidase-like deaminating enzyme